jgi:hypothetical protein
VYSWSGTPDTVTCPGTNSAEAHRRPSPRPSLRPAPTRSATIPARRDAHAAFSAIDRVTAYVARVLDADNA